MTVEADWRFVDSEDGNDGASWLDHTTDMSGFIDFRNNGDQPYSRIMVATGTFVERNILAVVHEGSVVIFPAMLVVPDGHPSQIRAFIDGAVTRGGLAHFSSTFDRSST